MFRRNFTPATAAFACLVAGVMTAPAGLVADSSADPTSQAASSRGGEGVFRPLRYPRVDIDILWPGDANADLRVDILDFNIMKENFGRGTLPGSPDPFYSLSSTWEQGDFTLDRRTDIADFHILKKHFGWVLPDSAVPEPPGAALAMAGSTACLLVALSRRRRRHSTRS